MPVRPWIRAALLGSLAVALVAITLLGLDRGFGNGDEVIYAQNVREMVRGGDYTALHWQGVTVLQRPSTPFVFAAATAALVDGEAGLRLASALFSAVILLLVYVAAWRTWDRHDLAAVATLLCAGAPSFHLFSRSLLSDPSFVAALTLALAGTLWALRDPRGLVVAAAGLGGAVACKSLAATLPGLALAPWFVVAARRHANRRMVVVAAAAFAALAAPFYVIGFARFGARFWHEHVGYSLMARARGDLEVGMPGGVTAYARYLLDVDGLPVLLWMGVAIVGGAWAAIRWKDRALGVVASYALFLVVALSLVGTRLPHYLLPLYPAAALCSAGLLAGLLQRSRWLASRPAYMALAPLVAVTLLLVGIARPQPEAAFLPSPEARALGLVAKSATEPGEIVYAVEWYAPALGYYADRELKLVTASPRLFEILDDVDFLHAAGAVLHAPPPPPIPSIVAAGSAAVLEAAPWLRIEQVLDRAGPYLMVRARVVSPRPEIVESSL